MVNKKAQAQIITTVLIILLVLAAIIIIWQVISGTIESGAGEIEAQSSCLGLRVDVTNVVTGSSSGSVTIRPTKDITGYQVYLNGVAVGPGNTVTIPKNALETATVTIGREVKVGDEIEVIVTIGAGNTACPGTKHIVKN